MGKHDELAALLGATSKRAPFRRYLAASYAQSTRYGYASDVRHFKRWGGKIPSTEVQVAKYLAAFAGTLAYSTLERRLSAIHREHVERGHGSPVRTELVRATLRGIARTYSRRHRQMRPLLKEHLVAMVRRMRGLQGARDKALLLVGFMGGFRRAELVALNVEDIQPTRNGLQIQVRRSKTDQEGLGRGVSIPRLKAAVCAVAALKHWLGLARIAEGPIFRPLNRHGHVRDARLSSDAVACIVKRHVARIGLDASAYAGHSLRAGLVTSAARAGAAGWQIREQTGHKTDAMMARYIRDTGEFSDNVAKMIFKL